MKQTIRTLVLLFALLQVGISSAWGQGTLPPAYLKIQVGAFKNRKQAKLDSLFKIGSVYAEDAGNGLSRIVVGYYTDAVTADVALDEVRKSGFPDAFISKHKGAIESKAISLITPATVDALDRSRRHRPQEHEPVAARRLWSRSSVALIFGFSSAVMCLSAAAMTMRAKRAERQLAIRIVDEKRREPRASPSQRAKVNSIARICR